MATDPTNIYYDDHQADPRSDYDAIISGLRVHSTQSCQYWIKGLSALCKYWHNETTASGSVCTYMDQFDETAIVKKPTGYNNSFCDYLGRRFSCDKYETAEGVVDSLDQYWCVAPNIFLTGLGKHGVDSDGEVLLIPIPKEIIPGYCVGRCDEYGRGTGCGATPGESPIICSYYRPFQMGFGADEPHPVDYHYDDSFPKQRVIEADAITRAYAAATVPMAKRLPFAFKLYNLRAHFQKCGYWDDVTGARFQMPEGLDGIHLDIKPADYCTSPSESAIPYYTTASGVVIGVAQWLLEDVWSEAGTVLCNGAKPECPCYTGKWRYLTDEKMQEGMRITADQIFELRFWTADWGTQAEYDAFFMAHPNFGDATSTSIYTFTKWHRLALPEQSQMAGRKLDMCVPAILNQREFDPDLYLTINELLYPALGTNIGTSSPEHNQVYFPTLIRDPDTEDMYIRPLSIIYPYSSSTPFSVEDSCEDRGDPICIKPTCRMDFDMTSVVGSTVKDCNVYAFNLNYYDGYDSSMFHAAFVPEFNEHKQVSTISTEPRINNDDDSTLAGLSPREAFFIRLKRFIEFCDMAEPDAIAKSLSDSQGFFKIEPINLEINEINKVVICVEFSDHTWDFRIRDVFARWFGGVVLQTDFDTGSNQSGYDYLPLFFSADGGFGVTAGGVYKGWPRREQLPGYNTMLNECVLSDIFTVSTKKYVDRIGTEKYEYSYCVKKKTVLNTVVDTWARIGQSTYIWLDMDDSDINHLFEWGIEEVFMTRIQQEDEESCIGVANSIEMEVVDIETFVSGKLSVPPGARILKPKTDIIVGFFNSDWDLRVTYWYKYIANDDYVATGEEVIWPDFTDPNITFTESDLGLEITTGFRESQFVATNIRDESVALLAYFADRGSGRPISSFATKFIVEVVQVECRNVEINYSYNSPAIGWAIQPDTSQSQLANKRLQELQLDAPYNHYYAPPCGDHKLSIITGKGACWYPFTSCEYIDYYQEFAGGAFCTNQFQGTPRNDMRLCGPPEYKAFVSAGGGLADCVLPWHYRYSVGTDIVFAGYANIIHWVSIFEYAFNEWTLPTFGNRGREMVTKWLSTDHWAHTTYKDTVPPSTKKQWVPMVPDLSDFFISFNAFDEAYEADIFSFTCQLSFMLNDAVGEEIEQIIMPDLSSGGDMRKRFDEIYGIHGAALATYPPPTYVTGDLQKVAFYYFKDSDVIWAWRELWKDIEYSIAQTFFFVTYERPDYVYGYDKDEYRYICDEGSYEIEFEPPTIGMNPVDPEGEEKLLMFPSIKLGFDGKPRYFEVRYDDYDTSYVDWQDENEGRVDASGGNETSSEGGNIYEKTSGSEWSHDENIIFDSTAVETTTAAETLGRKIDTIDPISGDLVSTYFNTGIIAHITKDRLKYLPYEEEPAVVAGASPEGYSAATDKPKPEIYPGPESGGQYFTDYKYYHVSPIYTYPATVHPEQSEEMGKMDLKDGKCVFKVIITGIWGVYGDDMLCKPGVIITAGGTELYNLDAVSTELVFAGVPGTVRLEFRMEIKLDVTPNRMIELEEEFKIQLVNCPQHWIVVNDFDLFVASYKSATETIGVWERKYHYSKGSNFGDFTLNGPKIEEQWPLQYEVARDNAGVYFPASPEVFPQFWGEITARDKMRSVFAGEQYIEDESLTVTTDNLLDIEEYEQAILYQDAYFRDIDGDLTVFTAIESPPFKEFLSSLGYAFPLILYVTFRSHKIAWDDHYLTALYNYGSIWRPKGHIYRWSDQMERIYCYMIGIGHVQGTDAYHSDPIFSVEFVHLDTAEIEDPVNAAQSLRSSRLQYQLNVAENVLGKSAWANITGASDPLALADTAVDAPVVGAGSGGPGGVPVSGARA